MPSFRIPLAIALGAVAFYLVLTATDPLGPGLDPDSMSYVAAAKSFVHDGRLRVPEDNWQPADSTTALAHFPPGFPATIAAPLAAGMSAIQGARLIEAIAAFFTITLAAWLIEDAAGIPAAIATTITVIATPAIANVHENILSEPLFLALLITQLALMTRAPNRPLLSGLAATTASLVRYAGVSAIAAAGLWWLLRHDRPPKARIRDAILATLPGIAAMTAWVARTIHASHEETIRDIGVYGALGATLHEGATTLSTWLAPELDTPWRTAAAITVALALAALFARTAQLLHAPTPNTTTPRRDPIAPDTHRLSSAPSMRLLGAITLLETTYLAVVIAARLFADPDIPLDDRLLSPLLLLLDIAVVIAIAQSWKTWRAPMRVLAALVLLAWWGGSLVSTIDDAQYALEVGNDYADIAWQGSRLIAWVRNHAAGRPLFTNFPTALYFQAGRMARLLPQHLDSTTISAFGDTLAARHGLIIAFDRSSRYAKRPDSLLSKLPVRELARFNDGAVWEMK